MASGECEEIDKTIYLKKQMFANLHCKDVVLDIKSIGMDFK